MKILYENCISNVYKELDELYTLEEWSKKYIVIFGFNAPSEIEMEYFHKNDIKVEGFIDNSKDKWGMEYLGCKVYSPEELLGEYKENAFVLIASSAYPAMKRQLEGMGYRESQIYLLKSFGLDSVNPFPFDEGYEYNQMGLREIQMESLEIMKYIRDFCDNKGIRYFLSYGSLIGAVRHKGFIPWDDDIDILMPWRDYARFCNEFSDNSKYELFSVYAHNNSEKICNATFTKVINKYTVTEMFNYPVHVRRGLGIDIFPMNGYPDNEKERKIYDIELKNLFVLWNREVAKKIGSDEFDIYEYKSMWKRLEKAMTRYDYYESDYVGSVACSPYNHSIAHKSKYELPSKVLFEGELFDAPSDVDYILKETYGDYMTLPPEEERNPKHFFNTYKVTEKSRER